MTNVTDYLPERLNTDGRPLFRVIARPADGVGWAHPLLLSIQPVIVGEAAPETICLAPAHYSATLGPLALGPIHYYEKADCKRVAMHDGPHAYLSPEGRLMTFERCACQDDGSYVQGAFGDSVCWHHPAAPCDGTLTVIDTYSIGGNPWARSLSA